MTEIVLEKLLSEAVSLFVLSLVLFGVYRLTHQFIVVMSTHLETCCESLERIANAIESERK